MTAVLSVTAPQADAVPAWHHEFVTRVLPVVRVHGRVRFRDLSYSDREEAVAEVIALVLVSYVSLIRQGKDPTRFINRMAHFAVLRVKGGLTAGSPERSRDVLSRRAQLRRRFRVTSLDDDGSRTGNGWRALVVEGRKSTPAQIAATRIDFAEWLGKMHRRRREIAECLAEGQRTKDVARRFRVSPTRISLLRAEFRRSWRRFREK